MSHWLNYFDALDTQLTFRLEAEAFVERLEHAVPLSPLARVLDFGCGFGAVSATLAPKVAEVALWDGSPQMRTRATATLAGIANARVLDVEPRTAISGRFDLIIVNSVIQYMTGEELQGWLVAWKGLLAPGGRIVIADVVPADRPTYRDFFDQVMFGIRRGFILTALKEGLPEMRRYWATQHVTPLKSFSRSDLEALARGAGLGLRFLPRNLTCRTARMTLLLSTAIPSRAALGGDAPLAQMGLGGYS